MFNYDQLVNLFQTALKMGFAALATHGAMSSSNAELWSGVIGAAISWWMSHHSVATAPTSPPTTASQDNTAKLPPTILCAILFAGLAMAMGVAGCASSGSSRVTAGVWNDGLGFKRINTSTNGVLTTNSFHLHFPVPLTNLPTVIEGLGVGAF